MKTCSKCAEAKTAGEFYLDSSKKDGRHTVCKECVKADRKRRYHENPKKYNAHSRAYYQRNKNKFREHARRVRQQVLDYYGRVCACCGESTEEFLSIDHIDSSGAEHRRELGGYGRAIYRWLIKNNFPEGFQLLCYNCNCAKGFYGRCPHQEAA